MRCMSSLGLYLEWSLPPHDLQIVFVIVIPVGAHIFCSVKASRDYVTSKHHGTLSLDWPGHVGEHQSGRCCHDTQKGQPEWHWKQNCDSDSVSVRSESFHCIHCISFFFWENTPGSYSSHSVSFSIWSRSTADKSLCSWYNSKLLKALKPAQLRGGWEGEMVIVGSCWTSEANGRDFFEAPQ